jgi:S-adenosylmethionine:tRNA ribosyltransferase-isomerase
VNWGENQGNMYLCPMKQLQKLNLIDFDYALPNERIAYTPCQNRADSKLLVWNKKIIADSLYQNITDFVPANSTLLFNNSKVIAARILFDKQVVENNDTPSVQNKINSHQEENAQPTKNSVIEIFCLEPSLEYSPVQIAMQANNKVVWNCLVGGAKKWKTPFLEKKLFHNNKEIHFFAKKINQLDGKFLIEFSWDDASIIFSDILALIGQIPLPPYIERNTTEEDKDRYQTTFASEEGSVAAPTAGLHFSQELLNKISSNNIALQFLTLHVGAGTFLPVKTDIINDHPMHAEFFEIEKKLIQYIIENNNQLIVVGTTSLRTIESLYWLGVKIIANPKITSNDLHLLQWDAYELGEKEIPKLEALHAIVNWMERNQLATLISKTQLMIMPGYRFRMVKGLVTNFHQPKSTLLLIIAAIVGSEWKVIYQHALDHQYRFLSYGDGCLFWIPDAIQASNA